MGALEDMKAWRAQGENYKTELLAERGELMARVAEIDAALAELGAPKKNRGRPPGRARLSELAAADAAADAPPATPIAPPDVGPPAADEIATALYGLRDLFHTLPAAYRKAIELRASGKTVREVATILKVDKQYVSGIVFRMRTQLQAARQTGAKPQATAPAADGEDEEPDPAGSVVEPDTSSFRPSVEEAKEEQVHEPRRCTGCGKPGHRLPKCPDRADAGLEMYQAALAPVAEIIPRPVTVEEPAKQPTNIPRIIPATAEALERLMAAPTLTQLRLKSYYPEVGRPLVREHCGDMPRPCPYVSCSHHLYLDVNEDTGTIKFNFPHLDVWEMADSCSLDVADRGGITLEATGAILNLTRERIRQVEVSGLSKMKDSDIGLDQAPERMQSALGAVMG